MPYYVFNDANCKFESMTKEEILTAIAQAVATHEIHDVDTGFVTTIKERNADSALKIWRGTQAEYNAIVTPDPDTFYIITDDDSIEQLQNSIDSVAAADIARYQKFGATLFSGSAGYDENINVPNESAYNVFAVTLHTSTHDTTVIATRTHDASFNLDVIGGSNAITYLTTNTVEGSFSALYGGTDTWGVNVASISGTSATVTKIVGIM